MKTSYRIRDVSQHVYEDVSIEADGTGDGDWYIEFRRRAGDEAPAWYTHVGYADVQALRDALNAILERQEPKAGEGDRVQVVDGFGRPIVDDVPYSTMILGQPITVDDSRRCVSRHPDHSDLRCAMLAGHGGGAHATMVGRSIQAWAASA